jgi:hypothetical protein
MLTPGSILPRRQVEALEPDAERSIGHNYMMPQRAMLNILAETRDIHQKHPRCVM